MSNVRCPILMNAAVPVSNLHCTVPAFPRQALSRAAGRTSSGVWRTSVPVSRSLVKVCVGCPSQGRPAHGLREFAVRRVYVSEVLPPSRSASGLAWAACPSAVSAWLRFTKASRPTVCCASQWRCLSSEGALCQSGLALHRPHAKVALLGGLLLAHSQL